MYTGRRITNNNNLQMIKKPTSGGEVLLKKKGKKYFSKLAKEGWIKRKAIAKAWKQKK